MSCKGIFFLTTTSLNTFPTSFFDKHKIFLTKIMDHPLWKNASFAFFLNRCVYCGERLVYYLERHQILFPSVFWIKRYVDKILYFCPKPLTKPFIKNANFLTPLFLLSRKVCFLQSTSKIVFHELFPRSIRRLQGVIGGYKGMQKLFCNQSVPRYFFLVYFA